MPTRPTTTPTWSTDPNYAAGSDPWSGTGTRLEPDAGDKASGFVPAERPPAQWFNWLIGLLCDWAAWLAAHSGSDDEWSYPTPQTIKRSTPISQAQPAVAFTDWYVAPGAAELDAMADAARLHVPLQVRVGETLTGVIAHIDPQSARTGANRMTFRIYKVTENFGTASPSSADDQAIVSPSTGTTSRWDSGSTGPQDVTLTLSTPIVVTEGESFFLWVQSGNDSATAGKHDRIYAVRAAITKPGPR